MENRTSTTYENSDFSRDGQDLPTDDPTWGFDRSTAVENLSSSLDSDDVPGFSGVLRLRHTLPFDEGQHLHVTEHFTVGSWLRRPRRAVLLLNGSVFLGNSWVIPKDGYNAADLFTSRGMFVWTVDFIGSGKSSAPTNGLEATMDQNIAGLRTLIKYIRFFRAVSGIDLVGEGYGGMMAIRLAADAERVRSCVLTNTLYKDLVGGPATSPEMVQLLNQAPNGYFSIPPEAYEPFLPGAPDEVREYICQTQPGAYPTPAMLVILGNPPFFDPGVAKAPGLVLHGEKDFVLGPNDARDLADDYGQDGAQYASYAEGGHALRLESPSAAEWFWNQVIEFVDP